MNYVKYEIEKCYKNYDFEGIMAVKTDLISTLGEKLGNSIYRYSLVSLQLDNSIGEAEKLLKQQEPKTYKMYSIKEQSLKIQVPCQKCFAKGFVDNNCHACNGKGVHNKTLIVWEVREKPTIVEKIDRESKTGELRYWTEIDCFYEESGKYIHFNKKDAQKECDKRNIEKYGLDIFKQFLNMRGK